MQDSRAPEQKTNWGSRAPWLYSRASFNQNQYFCPGSKYKMTLGSGLHCKNVGAPSTPPPHFDALTNTTLPPSQS